MSLDLQKSRLLFNKYTVLTSSKNYPLYPLNITLLPTKYDQLYPLNITLFTH